jgi:hypothetical protein
MYPFSHERDCLILRTLLWSTWVRTPCFYWITMCLAKQMVGTCHLLPRWQLPLAPLQESSQSGSCLCAFELSLTNPFHLYRISVHSNKHNLQTYVGAVAGIFGVFATFSACLAFSIYRRRRRSALQELQDRERQSGAQSFRSSIASDDAQSMHGPAPFTPRYFPGTVPVAPPPYVPSVSATSIPSTTGSYHHIPPALPVAHGVPSPTYDAEPLDVPPPFSVAILTPVPPVLANAMRQAVPQLSPPGLVDDAEPPPGLSPIVPAVADTPSPQSLRRARSSNYPSRDLPTSSSLSPDSETRSLRTESRGNSGGIATLPQTGNDHSVVLDS